MSSLEERPHVTSSLSPSVFALDDLPNDPSEDTPATEAIPLDVSAVQSKEFSRRLVEFKHIAYCNATYNLHYTRLTTNRGHYKFVIPDTELLYRTVLFGEVLSMAEGTKLSAFGNHNTSWTPVVPITDKSLVKDILVLGAPTVATRNLLLQFDNQIISFHQMREEHAKEELKEHKVVGTTIPILKPLVDGGRERISVTLPLKYTVCRLPLFCLPILIIV